MIGLLLAGGALVVAFLANKGKAVKNLTFGMSFKNFGIDSVTADGFKFNVVVAVDNASNQTYTMENGKFTLRYPNNSYSKAGEVLFNGKTTVEPRSNSEISVKITIGALPAIKIIREFIRIRKAGGYIMKAGVAGTVSVLDMPSININQEINLFEYINNVYEEFAFVFDILFGKMKKDKTTSQGTEGPDRNTEVSTNTPTTTQKQLVAQGKARSKFWRRKPKV